MSAVQKTKEIPIPRHVIDSPLTTGEIEELAERWGQIAEDQEDFMIYRCLTELLGIRERSEEATMKRMERDLLAARASCDDDCDTSYNEALFV
jgi:hypothetical protein